MGYFNDNGTELNPDLFPNPSLCISCANNDKPSEEVVCDLARIDQISDE